MIYLIGFMGSGKTTVAKVLSEKLSMPLIEMDEEIEAEEKMKIPEIFKQKGEEYFRKKETRFLKTLSKDVIVSTGGGVIISEENRRLLREGTVIYLHASWETIEIRLKNDSTRPLWKGDIEEKRQRFNERIPYYEKTADIQVSVDHLSPIQIADAIMECLNR